MPFGKSSLKVFDDHFHGLITALIRIQVCGAAVDTVRYLDVFRRLCRVVAGEDPPILFRCQPRVLKCLISSDSAGVVARNDYV